MPEAPKVLQANLPLLTPRDRRAIADITKEFDIDFVALTYTCHGDDVAELREYLDSISQEGIKIIAKVPSRPLPHSCAASAAAPTGGVDAAFWVDMQMWNSILKQRKHSNWHNGLGLCDPKLCQGVVHCRLPNDFLNGAASTMKSGFRA